MPRKTDIEGEGLPPEILKRALLLACQRIADSSRVYEEVSTVDGWYEVFITHATSAHRAAAVKT